MSGKKRRNINKLRELYKNPLPIEFIDEFKPNNFQLVTSSKDAVNVSLVRFLNVYFKSLKQRLWYKFTHFFWKASLKKEKIIHLHFENVIQDEYIILVVGDKNEWDYLWFNGFFGKGTLSRSQPTWYERQIAKLSAPSSDRNNMALEEMTRTRRKQRDLYKQKRDLYEKKVEQLKIAGVLNPYEQLINEYLDLKKLKELISRRRIVRGGSEQNTVPPSDAPDLEIESSDEEIEPIPNQEIDPVTDDEIETVTDQEDFVLTIEEYLFLRLVVCTGTRDLWNAKYNLVLQPGIALNKLISVNQLREMVYNFAVYLSLREKKYIVKDGMKFGVDYIVYDKKGPVFQHAEYGILVRKVDLNTEPELANEDLLSRLRVLNSSMKKMVLMDVHSTLSEEDWEKVYIRWAGIEDIGESERVFETLLKNCKIDQMMVKRWSVDRNRE